MIQSLIKHSLLFTSTLILSGCISAATVITGAAGVGDSLYKSHQIKNLDRRITDVEEALKKLKEKKDESYVPSYVNMELFNKGLYDK